MTEGTQTYTINQDGSVSIKGEDGKITKYVKESDLGAVKVQLKDKEGEVSTLQASLATANTKYDTEHQTVLQVRAASEQFEKDAKESTGLKEKVTGLETALADLKRVSGESTTRFTERLRSHLETSYKIPKEKLADKDLTGLESIESTLQLTGVAAVPANYDGKSGVSGSIEDLKGKSPLALATMGYEASNKK